MQICDGGLPSWKPFKPILRWQCISSLALVLTNLIFLFTNKLFSVKILHCSYSWASPWLFIYTMIYVHFYIFFTFLLCIAALSVNQHFKLHSQCYVYLKKIYNVKIIGVQYLGIVYRKYWHWVNFDYEYQFWEKGIRHNSFSNYLINFEYKSLSLLEKSVVWKILVSGEYWKSILWRKKYFEHIFIKNSLFMPYVFKICKISLFLRYVKYLWV